MFLAHLPAGYLLTKKLQSLLKEKRFLILGLVAGILPDLDILYFYLLDNRQTLHHDYWTHISFYWVALALVSFLAILLFKQKKYLTAATIFFANIFLHLILDTIVGRIEWLYPFSKVSYYLFTVPVKYDFWVYNFIFHWSFILEIGIIIWAIIEALKNYYAQKSETD
ncbi:MAG: metal-dependent hydrolase [Patescibacteria group bacterium]|jgi:inner membrane protein